MSLDWLFGWWHATVEVLPAAVLICAVGAAAVIRQHNERKVDIVEVQFTKHAMERMREMHVTPGEVLAALDRPDTSYDQPRYGPHRRMAQRGRLAVAYVDNGARWVVVSVLWNTQAVYVRCP